MTPSLLRNDFVARYINRPQAGSVSDLSWEARRIIIYYSFSNLFVDLKGVLFPHRHCLARIYFDDVSVYRVLVIICLPQQHGMILEEALKKICKGKKLSAYCTGC